MRTDTAHAAWNTLWTTTEGRADWLVPEPDVVELAERLRQSGTARRVLDLGCGIGRHALHFARNGLDTAAVDLAEAGLAELSSRAQSEDLTVRVLRAPMTDLPFAEGEFDAVLAFNVIYHGDPSVVGAALAQVRRVLRPGGLFQATMLSKRNAGYGLGTEVARDTFVRAAAPDDADKHHPHFYCGARDLVALLDGFELLALRDAPHRKPGSWHWHFLAERIA